MNDMEKPDLAASAADSAPSARTFGEAQRLLTRQCYQGGPFFRLGMIQRANSVEQAMPIEIGIDFKELVGHCLAIESRFRVWRFVFAGLFAICAYEAFRLYQWWRCNSDYYCSTYSDPSSDYGPWLVAGCILLAALFGAVWHGFYIDPIVRRMRPGRQPPPHGHQFLFSETVHDFEEQNLVIHAGFDPFSFAGFPISRWELAFDVASGRKDASGARTTPQPISVPELETAVLAALQQAQLPGMQSRELYFVAGDEARTIPDLMVFPPPRRLSSTVASAVAASYPHLIRRYLWIRSTDSNGDIDISNFIRISHRGTVVGCEYVRCYLGPPAKHLRAADYENNDSLGDRVSAFIGGAFAGLMYLLICPFELHAMWSAYSHRSDEERQKEFDRNPRKSVGAPPPIRVTLSDSALERYFQRSDLNLNRAAVDRLLLDALLDALESKGVDVSDARNTVSYVTNSGIIVQGGDVNAHALAVGQNAKSQSTVAAGNSASA